MSKTLHYDFVNDKSLAAKIGPTLTCTRSGLGATYRNSAGVRIAAAANEPRFDHNASGESLGLLVEDARTNLFLNSDAPVTQNITTTAQDYTVSVEGSGTVTLSGTATGVASEGSPLTVTASAGTLTCTVAGGPDWVQVEAGTFATSMIQTAGSPVTRNRDNIQTSDLSWFNQGGEGSFYYQSQPKKLFGSNAIALLWEDGQNYLNFRTSTDSKSVLVETDNVIVVHLAEAIPYDGTNAPRIASGWSDTDDFADYIDGVAADTDVSYAVADGIATLYIGDDQNGGNSICGYVREIVYWSTRLSNDDLQEYSLNGVPSGNRNYIAVTRRTAAQMSERPRIQKSRQTLRSKFE